MKHLSIPLTFLLLLCVPRLAAGQTPEVNFGITNNHYCVNDSILISFSVPNITEYSYTISHTSPISSSPIIDAENVSHTITNINIPGPSASGTYQYSLDLYDSISLIHYYYNSIANITFHPRLDTVLILADDTNYCQGRSNIIRSNINNTNFTYEWYYSLNGSSGNTITNAGSTLNLASTSQNDDSVYYILFVSDGTHYARTPNSCASGSDTILIRTFDTITASITIIITDTANVPKLVWNQPAGDNSQHRGYQYQWQYRHDTTHVWTPIANANSTTYNLPLEQNSIHYRLKITSPCDSVESNSISSSDLWDMYNIIIDFVTGGISGDSAICYGDTPRQLSVRTLPSFISGARYVWQKKAVTGTSWDSCYDGRSYTPNPAYNDTMYRVQIKNTSGNVLYTTDSITIHVYTQLTTPHITAVADTVCYNTSPNLSIDSLATGEAPISHQWQIFNSSSDWTNVVNPNTPLTTTTSFRVLATDANNCRKISDSLIITVIPPLNITNLSIELDTSGTNPVLTSIVNSPSPSSTYPYQWQYRAIPTSSWTPLPNANNSTYELNLSLAGEYRLIISNSCENDLSNTFHTSSLWSGYQISGSSSVCYGVEPSPLTIRPLPSYIPNIRYVWQEKTTTSNWSDCSDTGRTHRPGVATTDKYYRVSIVMNTNNDTLFTTNSITIHVYDSIQKPILDTRETIICFNAIPGAIRITNPESDASFSYQWQWSNADTTNWSVISGAANSIYIPTEPLIRNRLYKVIATNTITGCNNDSDSLEIAVRQKLTAGILREEPNICHSTSVNLTFETNPSGGDESSYIYIWKHSTDGTYFIDDTTTLENHYQTEPIDSTRYYKVVVASSSCSETDSTHPIRINVWNFTPAKIPYTKEPVCAGTLPPTIDIEVFPQQGSENYTYQWQSATDTNSPQNILNQTNTTLNLTNPIYQINQTTYYRVLCKDEECPNVEEKPSNWCKMEVNPLPEEQMLDGYSPTDNFCYPGTENYSITTIDNSTYSYHWELTDPSTGRIESPDNPSTKIEWYKTDLPNTILQLTTTDNTTRCERKNNFNIIFNREYVSPDSTRIKKKGQHILICADSTNNAVYIWGQHRKAPYTNEDRDTLITNKRYHWFDTINPLEWDYFVDISYSKVNHGCDTRTYYIATAQSDNDASPATLTVSPNPSQGEVNYSLNQSIDGDCLIQIFDATGHLVYTQECSGYVADTPIKIDTQLKQGIYILSLTSEKIMLNKKIIVQ